MVTICTKNLTFNNSKFCPHSDFMCFVWISEQTEIFPYTNLTDWFYNIDLTLYRPEVNICTTSLTLKISMFYPQSEIMYFVWISEETEIFPYTTLNDWFYNIDLTLFRPVVTVCTTSLTFNNSTFCTHSKLMCFVWISEHAEIFLNTNLTDWYSKINLILCRPVITICTTNLTFNSSTFCPFCEFMYFVWISVQIEIFPYTNSTDWFYNLDLTLYRPVVTHYI